MMGNASLSAVAAALSLSGMIFAGADGIYQRVQPAIIEGRASVPGPVFPGELATVRWDVIKRANCPGQSSRVWSGEGGFAMAEALAPTSLPYGSGSYTIPTMIPQTAPEGALSLTISGFFECPHKPKEYFTLTPVVMQVRAK